MDATETLPDDLKKVWKDALALKQRYIEARQELKDLGDISELLKQEISLSRENEEKEKLRVEFITEELMKLQISNRDIAQLKNENQHFKDLIKEYKNKIQELNNNLEKERLSCHELMQRSRKECEEQTNKSLAGARSEAENLRGRLLATEEQLRKKTVELREKLGKFEHDKNEEIRQITYDEKINKLQSALTTTQNENRNIRDRLQFNTMTYQKKIQELERRAQNQMHPALKTISAQNFNRSGGKNLPQLHFTMPEVVTPELPPQPEISDDLLADGDAPRKPTSVATRKRRKLFTQKNTD